MAVFARRALVALAIVAVALPSPPSLALSSPSLSSSSSSSSSLLTTSATVLVDVWLTAANQSSIVGHQAYRPAFGNSSSRRSSMPVIRVEPDRRFQTMDGFGLAMTGGSARLLMAMRVTDRQRLLRRLFAAPALETTTATTVTSTHRSSRADDDEASAGISVLRLTVGASDMSERPYSYDDVPAGAGDDWKLARFSLGPDLETVVPVMQAVLRIRPGLTVLASPWSAPEWMKTGQTAAWTGGRLRPDCYDVYARYLLRYLDAMAAHGITIHYLTVQNEPLNPKNTPSMSMSAAEQALFIGQHLGPLLRASKKHAATRILAYDHNCDEPGYALRVLSDPLSGPFTYGSAFHLYAGPTKAMSAVHDAFPDKSVFLSEQMVVQQPLRKNDTLAIAAPVAAIVVGAARNYAKFVLLWNLAADARDGPHTGGGGCTMCQGAVTIETNTSSWSPNLALWTVSHAARFVGPGSRRILSFTSPDDVDSPNELQHVAFQTPDGSTVLIVANVAQPPAQNRTIMNRRSFGIAVRGLGTAHTELGAGDVATFLWRAPGPAQYQYERGDEARAK